MELDVTCPSCGKQFYVEYDGKSGAANCPFCNAALEFGDFPVEHPLHGQRRVNKLRHPPSHSHLPVAHKTLPTSEPPKSSASLVEMIMWVLIIGAAVGLGWWWWSHRAPSTETTASPPSAAPQLAMAPPPKAPSAPPPAPPPLKPKEEVPLPPPLPDAKPLPPPPEEPPPPPPPPPPVQEEMAPAEPEPPPAPKLKEPLELKLPNLGFDASLEGWNILQTAGLVLPRTDAARSGARGLRVTDQSGDRGTIITYPFPAKPGEKFQCWFWARLVSGSGTMVSLRFTDPQGQISGNSVEIPAGTKDWKEFTVVATVPERTKESEICIATTEPGKVVVDLDDFRLSQIP